MQQTNQFRLERQNNVTLLHIQGDITAQSEPVIIEAYKKADEQGAAQHIE